MNNLKLTQRACAAAVAGLMLSGAVNAAGVGPVQPPTYGYTILLDQSNQNERFQDGINYIQVNISESKAGTIDFRIEALDPLQSLVSEHGLQDAGFQAFAFNFGRSGATIDNLVLPYTWAVEDTNTFDGFGDFDVVIRGTWRKQILTFSIAGLAGDKPLDYLTMLSGGFAPEGNWLFGAELGAKGAKGEELASAKFAGGTVVPIPAAVWLMVSGLALLGCFRRKSFAVAAQR